MTATILVVEAEEIEEERATSVEKRGTRFSTSLYGNMNMVTCNGFFIGLCDSTTRLVSIT